MKKTWLPIVVMYLLFVMISFVTNLCNPMAVILKSNFAVSNFAAQLGNAANFIAYAIMGIPSGLLLRKIGYRNTALVAIGVGIVGVFLQYMSGWSSIESFAVYLAGAFVAGFCITEHLRLLWYQKRYIYGIFAVRMWSLAAINGFIYPNERHQSFSNFLAL